MRNNANSLWVRCPFYDNFAEIFEITFALNRDAVDLNELQSQVRVNMLYDSSFPFGVRLA